MSADFFANYLLRNDLVAQVLLEVLPGDALFGSLLLELFQTLKLHVLAHLIEPFDQLGVTADAEILAFFEEELLIDEIAENIFFTFRIDPVGIARVLLLSFFFQLVFAAGELRTGDDLAVDAGDDLFDDLGSCENRKTGENDA